MRITRSRPSKRAPEHDLMEIFASIQNNPAIASYEIKVDKVADVSRVITRDTAGRTTTQTLISPILEESTRYHGTEASTYERDHVILTLLKRGLTQVEVSQRLGISQSLVSKVSRRRIY